ncbi:helix-turn-helix transcriptional regulator [Merdimmobilis hominis]|uniref:helix-turn-helix domain-containing protein n=2 Tax=Merdimmobilis hominis TaxID=2897707 RepID=UPI0028052314|nr:helix-turn-helix transcriptional regulator [uncultured Merdimmobilis sp.]
MIIEIKELLFQKGGKALVSYRPLWKTMEAKAVTTYTLIEKYGVSSHTIHNLKHNKGITVHTLERLCNILECTPNDVLEFIKE